MKKSDLVNAKVKFTMPPAESDRQKEVYRAFEILDAKLDHLIEQIEYARKDVNRGVDYSAKDLF